RYAYLGREPSQFLFNVQVPFLGDRRGYFRYDFEPSQVPKDVSVENRELFTQPDVPEEMAGFFVAESLDILDQPLAKLEGIETTFRFMTTRLSPTEIFNGRKIFLIGGTGFLGKVTLSILLHRFPKIGRVYVTVRARSQEESETRFWNNVISEPPFDPVRERYGAAFDDFIRDKVAIVGGDIAEDNLG